MLSAVTGTADHVRRNRAAWDRQAAEYAGPGLRAWAMSEPAWGIWHVAEAQAGVLPADLTGRDSIELGCGTGYVSAWLARRGARPVGLDNSAAQLATARQLQDGFGLPRTCLGGDADRVFDGNLVPGGTLGVIFDAFSSARHRSSAKNLCASGGAHVTPLKTGPARTTLAGSGLPG
jgi:SAM-dependent methyltransferase